MRTEPVDGRGTHGTDESERNEEHAPVQRGPDARVAHTGGASRELGHLAFATTEELDHHGARDVEALGHLRVHLGVQFHLPVRDGADPGADALGGCDEQRQHHERQQSEPPFERGHRGERGGEHHDVRHDAAERGGDGGLRTHHVVVETADQRAGLRAGEERNGHLFDLVEEGDAQVVDEALADAGAQPALHDGEHRVTERGHHEDEREERDASTVPVGDCGVEDGAEKERRSEREERRRHDGREESDDAPLVRRGEASHPAQRLALDARALHRMGITRNHHVWTHSHEDKATGDGAPSLCQCSEGRSRSLPSS